MGSVYKAWFEFGVHCPSYSLWFVIVHVVAKNITINYKKFFNDIIQV